MNGNTKDKTVGCEGWWYQAEYGRQPMDGLVLTFAGETIRGVGHDIIGPFTLSGTIKSDGAVWIYKSYIGIHGVEYVGSYDGEGTMKGHWKIGTSFDKWAIYIKRAIDEFSNRIEEFVA
jgi:hypothetical protein